MNPLLDTTTLGRRTAEGARAAETARVARAARRRDALTGPRHPVRRAVGGSLVKAGLRLLHV